MARVGGGKADAYLRFIIETVRPLILESFRASAERRSTGLFGSSMGGLISLYGFFAYPEHFGLVGAMSPSLWFAGGRILDYIRKRPPILGKIYFDVGSEERSLRATRSIAQLYDAQLNEILLKKGYRPEKDMVYVLEEGASHNEAYWARRLPEALRFLLTE
jgi:predicted alpha/beta superfamily hydrolase